MNAELPELTDQQTYVVRAAMLADRLADADKVDLLEIELRGELLADAGEFLVGEIDLVVLAFDGMLARPTYVAISKLARFGEKADRDAARLLCGPRCLLIVAVGVVDLDHPQVPR